MHRRGEGELAGKRQAGQALGREAARSPSGRDKGQHLLPAAGYRPAGAGGQAVGGSGPCQGGRAGGRTKPPCQRAGQPGPALPGPRYRQTRGERANRCRDRRGDCQKGCLLERTCPRASVPGTSPLRASPTLWHKVRLRGFVKFKQRKPPRVSMGLGSWVSSPIPALLHICLFFRKPDNLWSLWGSFIQPFHFVVWFF